MFYIDSEVMTPNHDNLRRTVMASMKNGVQLQNLEVLREMCSWCMAEAAKVLSDNWGITRPNSPDEIIKFLAGCDIPEVHQACCENGKWSSKATGLRILAQQGFAFAADILAYRKAKSYSQAVVSLAENMAGNGRVYPDVSIQKTNRISYSSPALMNIPGNIIWSVIGPRNSSSTLVSVDVHQQEPLILINMLGNEQLKLLARNNRDIYRAAYKMLFGTDCTDKERSEFKMCWNATSYGASKKSLVERCRFIDGGAVYTFMHHFPEMHRYIGSSYMMAKRDIQKTKTYFGTELYADKTGGALRRSLLDLPIQGTGSDILAFLVEHFQTEMALRGLEDRVKFYYSRHDEVVLEVDTSMIDNDGEDAVEDMLQDVFEHEVDDWVPFRVEVEFHYPDLELLGSPEELLRRCRADSFSDEDG